jgi:2-polyprenyl-6-methoxyphenol hydroxylase-like FAD-dependent oxidoreductase
MNREERPSGASRDLVDVLVVGAGPTGLMLAVELRLAGVGVLVLERQPEPRTTPKAGGLNGQILEHLRYRGLLDRFEAAGTTHEGPLRLPFGGLHVDFAPLPEPPMDLLLLPQPELERVLAALAVELGAEIRRGHEVVGLSQGHERVTATIGSEGGEQVRHARYLVGCDGSQSRVRELADVAFPGQTYPEVQRLAQVSVPANVTLLDHGDIEVEGFGRIPFGFTRTERGEFALGSTNPHVLGLYTSEEETADYDDDQPLTLEELRASIKRVLGVDLPLEAASRLTRFTFHARLVERFCAGRVLLAGDAAHLFPSPGVALNAGMLDSVNLAWKLAAVVGGWAPPGLLDTYHEERQRAAERTMLHTQAQVALRRGSDPSAVALRELFAELLSDPQPLMRLGALIAASDIRYPPSETGAHPLVGGFAPDLALTGVPDASSVADLLHLVRPVLLLLVERPELQELARAWEDRVEIVPAVTEDRPADALLIRPDAYVAWAAGIDEPASSARVSLRGALAQWFGAPQHEG